MASLFYYSGTDVFKTAVGTGFISFSDAFNNFDGQESTLSIITDVSINGNETIQFFQTFDDLISFYYFGKGLGNISLTMMLFCSCDSNNAPGLDKVLERIGQIRGSFVDFSIGKVTFSGVLTSYNVQMVGEPVLHFIVNINLAMIDHTLEAPYKNQTSC